MSSPLGDGKLDAVASTIAPRRRGRRAARPAACWPAPATTAHGPRPASPRARRRSPAARGRARTAARSAAPSVRLWARHPACGDRRGRGRDRCGRRRGRSRRRRLRCRGRRRGRTAGGRAGGGAGGAAAGAAAGAAGDRSPAARRGDHAAAAVPDVRRGRRDVSRPAAPIPRVLHLGSDAHAWAARQPMELAAFMYVTSPARDDEPRWPRAPDALARAQQRERFAQRHVAAFERRAVSQRGRAVVELQHRDLIATIRAGRTRRHDPRRLRTSIHRGADGELSVAPATRRALDALPAASAAAAPGARRRGRAGPRGGSGCQGGVDTPADGRAGPTPAAKAGSVAGARPVEVVTRSCGAAHRDPALRVEAAHGTASGAVTLILPELRAREKG